MDNIIGRKLDGRYEIKEIIGIGGMAVVYKAYDSIDDRIVAVKVLKEEYLTNEDFKRRFRNESKAIAVLSHPNIVKVYDVSLGEKLQYIVMEYIDGITLKEYIDQQHILSWKEALHFTVQILHALQHAHEKGIIHRDIKPQNIMMLEDGTIKVADFGIARFASSETRTVTDKAIGSVHYISPEQARGGETDEKSDIYSVGVMLFEMLTGQLPFESENAVSVAIMQMQQEPRHPREINDKIPEGLEDITLRAMQKDPLQRYESASDMLADIDEFKRNPSIHFEYKYFVDDNPTKYVDAINKVKGNAELTDKKDDKKDKKDKKVGVIPILSGIAALVLVAAIAIIFGVMWKLGAFSQGTASIKVPNLVGKLYSTVSTDKSITKNWKIVENDTQPNDAKPAGTILKQDLSAGSTAKPHSTITVTVSKGPNMVKVLNEVNKNKSDAQVELQNAGFVVTLQPKNDDNIAKDNIISSDPAPDTSVQSGSTVTLYYSLGPVDTSKPVPTTLVGTVFKNDTATSILQAAGLKLGNTIYKWSDTTKGNIISTNPNGGTKAPQNSAVDITVSCGKEPSTFSGSITAAVTDRKVTDFLNGGGIVVITIDANTKTTIKNTDDASKFASNVTYKNSTISLQTDNPGSTPELDFTIVTPTSTGGNGKT